MPSVNVCRACKYKVSYAYVYIVMSRVHISLLRSDNPFPFIPYLSSISFSSPELALAIQHVWLYSRRRCL